MKIIKRGHSLRTKRKRELALRVATDYNAGIKTKDIAKKNGISLPYVFMLLKELAEENE
jgi:DNA-binding transcriptional regulator LsrR (DeoR family)